MVAQWGQKGGHKAGPGFRLGPGVGCVGSRSGSKGKEGLGGRVTASLPFGETLVTGSGERMDKEKGRGARGWRKGGEIKEGRKEGGRAEKAKTSQGENNAAFSY